MRNALMLASAAATLGLLAGCGSSKSNTSRSSSAASTSTPASATSSSTSAATTSAGGGYGAGASGGTSASAVTVTSKHDKVGTILAAGPKKLTVYLFESDTPTHSTCSGACSSVWPPVTTSGSTAAVGAAMSADLGTITRPDGSKQVTYKGHPLYYFSKDKDSGDSYGQGLKTFGSEWYVLAPSGKKVDNS
jgi:predicted lipoprotein with Yx(FWY)xxD motif